MTKKKFYKYTGINGSIYSGVFLEGTPCEVIYELTADEGCLITNDMDITRKSIITPESSLYKWREIEEGQN